MRPGTKRPINTPEEAARIIEALRRENKNLRQQKNQLRALIDDLTRQLTTK